MLDGEGHVILTDFGLSKEFEETDAVSFNSNISLWAFPHLSFFQVQRTNSYCGTIEYMVSP